MIGREVPVLVEGPSPDTDLLWQARMSTQAPEIDGTVLINDFEGAEPAPGQMRQLRITEAHDYDLIGTLLASTEPDVRRSAPALDLIHITSGPGFVIPNQIPAR
jgi:ribosomal protein S12 methylthiotransferase